MEIFFFFFSAERVSEWTSEQASVRVPVFIVRVLMSFFFTGRRQGFFLFFFFFYFRGRAKFSPDFFFFSPIFLSVLPFNAGAEGLWTLVRGRRSGCVRGSRGALMSR